MASPVILFGADGTPQPPQDILRRLRAVDPRLGIKFIAHVPETPWCVTLAWHENDARRERVRCGELAPENAVDVVCRLPRDCSVGDAAAFITRRMAMHPEPDIKALVNNMNAFHQADNVGEQLVAEALAELTDNRFGAETHKVSGRRKRVK
jgi:hypothetical protein